MAKLSVAAIVAMDEGSVIGADNQLPWRIPEDQKYFARVTTGHTVLMGRKTWDSLPPRFRPLPNRKNIVVSRRPRAELDLPADVELWNDPLAFIAAAKRGEVALPSGQLWVVGGAEIYRQTMESWDELYLTRVHSTHSGNAYFPPFEDQFELVSADARDGFTFERYTRKR